MKISAIFDRTIGVLAFLAGVLIISAMLTISADALLRYFWGQPTEWVLEFSEYALLFITFLSAAWLLKVEGHVKMDLLLTHLKPGTQTVINITTSIIGAIICVIIFRYTAQDTWISFQRGDFFPTLLQIPKAPVLAIIPVGFLLLFIQFVRRAYQYLGDWKEQHRSQKSKP